MNNLSTFLKNEIKKKNYLDLNDFLNIILYEKDLGFYNNLNKSENELIGSKGHFITSPEISQLFGELIGIWILNVCDKLGFNAINLLELGPGKGSLMNDILRVLKNSKSKIEINLHLLEVSEKLKIFQKQKLDRFNISKIWYDDIVKIKNNLNKKPIIIISNEFFDCFPIRQYKYNKVKNDFTKVVIKLRDNNFYICEKEIDEEDNKYIKTVINKQITSLDDKTVIEYSPMISLYLNEICNLIKINNGICLSIDYGKNDPYGSTIQSVYRNSKSLFFEKIGESDYSCLVDFNNIKKIVENNGLFCFPLQSQRDFLLKMGINFRIENLAKNATNLEKKNLLSSYERLISKRYMGGLFKVNCFSLHKFDLLGF